MIRDRVVTLARVTFYVEREPGRADFPWPDAVAARSWDRSRYPATSEEVRALEDIAPIELIAVLRAAGGEDAAGAAARALGIRLHSAGRERLCRAAPMTGH